MQKTERDNNYNISGSAEELYSWCDFQQITDFKYFGINITATAATRYAQ